MGTILQLKIIFEQRKKLKTILDLKENLNKMNHNSTSSKQTFVGSTSDALNLCPMNTITGRPNLSSPLRYKQPKLAIERKSSFLALRSKRSYLKRNFYKLNKSKFENFMIFF